MAGNTFRMNETVVVEVEMTGVDTSISDADITITNAYTGTTAVSGTTMEDIGNQRYRYFWDTRVGYSEYYTLSGAAWVSGTSGYSTAVSGLYTARITARDANNHYGTESFNIRIG
jgi:hypothetical protein